jgi:hypothetical protein
MDVLAEEICHLVASQSLLQGRNQQPDLPLFIKDYCIICVETYNIRIKANPIIKLPIPSSSLYFTPDSR